MTSKTNDLRSYKVYLHGEFVGAVEAMTKGEAVAQVANKHYNRNECGLMAVEG